MGHLLLIDGHHLMYRAYWAIPRTLKTSAGELVNTVFGMASMILTALKAEEPDGLLICFDAGEETFRHEKLATYKEGRPETPEDFFAQIPRVMELVDVWGISHVSDRRYEADDFLCTYAREGEKEGMRVTVVTGDRDALQLASSHVQIAIPHKGYSATEYLDAKGVEAKYGIRPDQVPAYKGLTGDVSDNLPGVKGIGPKTASQLLQKFQTLEGIYTHLKDIRSSVREKLEVDREQAFFCKKMAELVCDIPLPISLDALFVRNLPLEPLVALFREMEFTLLLKRLQEFCGTDYGRKIFQCSEALNRKSLLLEDKNIQRQSSLF